MAKVRFGTTLNEAQVRALMQLFETLDRGGDPSVALRSKPVRRFRAMLGRIARNERYDMVKMPCFCARGGRGDCPTHGTSEVADKLRYELSQGG